MRKTVSTALTGVLLVVGLGAGTANAADILLLGDGEAEYQVQPALEDAGHDVVFGGLYYEWDGISPNVNDFDSVVFLDGYDYGYGFEDHPEAEAALVDFVHNGGGLVVTEWIMYDTDDDLFGDDFLDLMPVTYDGDYDYESTWTVLDTGHPLTAGLPAGWLDEAGYSWVTAVDNATVVIENDAGYPMLTYRTDVGGTVVHINHDMTYETDIINEHSLQALVNAAEFAAIPEPASLSLLALASLLATRRRS